MPIIHFVDQKIVSFSLEDCIKWYSLGIQARDVFGTPTSPLNSSAAAQSTCNILKQEKECRKEGTNLEKEKGKNQVKN